MLNHIDVQGRLVAAPELRQTPQGTLVASFRVACDRDRMDQNGQRQADFFPVVAWGKTGEFVNKWFGRGDQILVSGRLTSRNYKDKQGNNRTAYEIVAEAVNFCGSKSQSAGREPDATYQQPTANYSAPAYSAGSNDDFAVIDEGEDLPF